MICLSFSGGAILVEQTTLAVGLLGHSLAHNQSASALRLTPIGRKLRLKSESGKSLSNLPHLEKDLRGPGARQRERAKVRAAGHVSGQLWKNKSDREAERTESGSQASTSDQSKQSQSDRFGEHDEEYWQAKAEEETSQFMQSQTETVESNSLSFQANRKGWEVLGSACVAVSVGVTCYSVWEKAEYERLLQRRATATTGVAPPPMRAPRDWSAWQV